MTDDTVIRTSNECGCKTRMLEAAAEVIGNTPPTPETNTLAEDWETQAEAYRKECGNLHSEVDHLRKRLTAEVDAGIVLNREITRRNEALIKLRDHCQEIRGGAPPHVWIPALVRQTLRNEAHGNETFPRRSVESLETWPGDHDAKAPVPVQPVLGTAQEITDKSLAFLIRFARNSHDYLAFVELWERRGELKASERQLTWPPDSRWYCPNRQCAWKGTGVELADNACPKCGEACEMDTTPSNGGASRDGT